MATLTVFHYPNCSTCKKALRWLDAHGIAHAPVHIVETPPSVEQLRQAQKASGKTLRQLFNVSGNAYREGGFKDRLPKMSEDEALAALAADGMLIKRPLVLGKRGRTAVGLVGFREDEWAQRLG